LRNIQKLKLRRLLRWFVFTLQIAVVLSVVGWGACTPNPPEWKEVLSSLPSPSPGPSESDSINTTDELVVYLDTSASMAGYVMRDGQSIFGKTLRELRYAAGTFGNSEARVLVRRIASDVGPLLSDMELATASQDQKIYSGGETNLAGAISTFQLPLQEATKTPNSSATVTASAEASNEHQPIPRFHLLVTDGVQSTRQGSAAHDCTAGSDQFCVRQKIGELLKKKWGGCVLGIRADFRGKVYSEVSKASLPYDTRLNDPATFRPFYLYVFSPDPRALDSLVHSLKERLRPLLSNSEPIRELNLSFPYTNGTADFDMHVDKESKGYVDRSKDRGGPPVRFTVRVDIDTENAGPKPLSVIAKLQWSPHALDTASEDELAQLLTWSIEPIYPAPDKTAGKRLPEIQILRTHVDTPGQITIEASTRFPPGTGEPSWRGYVLKGRLNLNQATPPWIKRWSVDLDTTREACNRTFNLETALLGLWNTLDTKDQVVAEAHIRIGPK
jgi:hypothetical protein